MKVDIIYRGCGQESPPLPVRDIRPAWFSKRRCFESVWQMTSRAPSEFALHVIWDGPDCELLGYIRQFRMSHDALRRIQSGTPYSILEAFDYADMLSGDWIYFVEDDYLHAPDAADVFLEGASRFNLLTLYDHLDRYTRADDITQGKEEIALTPSCHWRTAESTTSTWSCSRSLWNEIRDLAKERGAADRHLFQDLVRRGIRLWTPIPGRSTHCFLGYMSPRVDWSGIAKECL